MRPVRIALVNIGILAIGLLLAELTFGGWFRPEGLDPLTRLNVPRDVRIALEVKTPYEAWSGVYTRDRGGLRGAYTSFAVIDILTVGGSTTDQRFVPDGQTWQDAMMESWASRGRHVTVVNAGVDGHSTKGHLLAFELWFPKLTGLKPRLIVIYAGVNEQNGGPADGWFGENAATTNVRSAVTRVLDENSAVFFLMRTALGVVRARRIAARHDVTAIRAPLHEVPLASFVPAAGETAPGLADYAARLRALGARIRALGAEPVFVTQPRADALRRGATLRVSATLDRDTYGNLWQLNRTTMATCAEIGAICIDLEAELELDPEDFYDVLHNTPRGARKIGTYLQDKLKERL